MFDPEAFSTAFDLAEQPDPDGGPATPPIDPNGPWISHGVIHLGRPPKH